MVVAAARTSIWLGLGCGRPMTLLCSSDVRQPWPMRPLVSSGFQAGVTDSFHLINTIRTSTTILTAEVRKVVRAGATDRVLEALYPLPTAASGQNLRAFSSQTSAAHDHSIATLWLFTVIGLYEVWAAELPIANSEANCQFPTRGYNALSTKAGVGAALDTLQTSASFTTIYGAALASDPRMIARARLDDALAVYRLFKECRNSLAHSGGLANDRVDQWGADVQARAADLLADAHGAVLPAPRFAVGDRVVIDFEQMRAFVALVLRIAFTIDAAILTSTTGEAEFSRRWAEKFGRDIMRVNRKALSRGRWIGIRLAEAALPLPPAEAEQADLIAYLISNKMIRDIP